MHIRFGYTPPQLEGVPAAGSSNEPSAPKAKPAEPAAAVPPVETPAAGGFTMIALQRSLSITTLIHWKCLVVQFHLSGEPKPKGKAKAKRKAQENPKAVWDLRKARLSQLDTQPFPLVDRVATKELVQNVIFTKAPKASGLEFLT